MTIAIALKVGDGVVLGADSAVTITGQNQFVNAYFNAES
jgi:20S proteasome alpha/beta subunit